MIETFACATRGGSKGEIDIISKYTHIEIHLFFIRFHIRIASEFLNPRAPNGFSFAIS